jgi:hypothetical protein
LGDLVLREERKMAFKVGKRLRDETAVNPLETRFSRKVQEIVYLLRDRVANECTLLSPKVNLFHVFLKKKKSRSSKGEDAMLSQLPRYRVDLPYLNCNV